IAQPKANKSSYASISSSGNQTSSVGVNPQISVPPPSQVGSPLFWIGVGVGLSALFSWLAGRVKKYAMDQAFRSLSQQMNAQNISFGSTNFTPGSNFPFPSAMFTRSSSVAESVIPLTSQPVTVEVPKSEVKEIPPLSVDGKKPSETSQKKYAFVDVSPEDTLQKNAFENYEESVKTDSEANTSRPVTASASKREPVTATTASASSTTSKASSLLSVDALEKMMEDPTVQKMVYPYLPEEMRNPSTFK
ncbi:hypothetical protein M569_09229, partial [Genlisea aurea]